MHVTHIRRCKTLLVAAGAFVLSSVSAANAVENVSWTRPANVVIRGNMLEKTGGCDGCDDAGAVSRQVIRSGSDGFVEFRVTDPYSFWVAGLTQSGAAPRFNDIDFAFRFNGNGWADVLENGEYQPTSDIEVDPGDVFRIAVTRGRVEFMKNGRLVHDSQQPPRYPLVAATALGTVGTRVAAARIESSGRTFANADQSDYDDSPQFSSLDRNRDGVISRPEWSGPLREFLQLDTNRDSRISRAEYGSETSIESPSAVGTSGRQVVVDSRERWTNTGIFVQAGDVVTFDADGSIQLSTNGNDISTPAGADRQAPEAPLQARPAGVLIARIGNSTPVAVGVHRTMRAPVSGQIFLGVNDDHLPDNNGQYQVSINIEPR